MVDWWLAEVHVDADGEEQDGDEGEVDDGVDEDGEAAGLEVAELDDPALAGDLEQQPRGEEDEQDQPDEHRRPVRHNLRATTTASSRLQACPASTACALSSCSF
jgi:hypothetical protein